MYECLNLVCQKTLTKDEVSKDKQRNTVPKDDEAQIPNREEHYDHPASSPRDIDIDITATDVNIDAVKLALAQSMSQTDDTGRKKCKHCGEYFTPSEYETHMGQLAKSARRGAACRKCGEPTFYFSEDRGWECLNPRCTATSVENAATVDHQDNIRKTEQQEVAVHNDVSSRPESVPPKTCPNCSKRLQYDSKSKLFRCKNCRRIYTDQDLYVGDTPISKRWKKPPIRVKRWVLAFLGALFLGGGIAYFPYLAAFLQRTGVHNVAFIQSMELPLEIFGGVLLFLALFVKRRAKAVTVFSIVLIVFLSGLFVWHTPHLRASVSDTVNNWIQRVSGEQSDAASTPTISGTAPIPTPFKTPERTSPPLSPTPPVITSTPKATPPPSALQTTAPTPPPQATPQTPTPIPPVLDKTVTVDGQQYRVQFWQLNLNGRVEATVILPTGEKTNYGSNWSGFTLEQVLANAKASGNKAAWAVALAAGAGEITITLTPNPVQSLTATLTVKGTATPSTTPTTVPRLQELYLYMLDLINKDRRANGLSPVVLGSNTAAQKHAEDKLANNHSSHWGTDGMKPYMRYTLAGGYYYDAENGFVTRTTWYGGRDPFYKRDPLQMLDEAEKSLMGSPGHRRNILDKWHKKVNLGIAYSNDSLHLAQDFEGDYLTFTTLPTLSGNILSMAGRLTQGSLYNIAIYYDPVPQPLTPKQLEAPPYDYAYGMGDKVGLIIPPAPPGSYYSSLPPNSIIASLWNTGSGGQFSITGNISPALQRGKGVYTVMMWADINGESKDVTNYSIFVR